MRGRALPGDADPQADPRTQLTLPAGRRARRAGRGCRPGCWPGSSPGCPAGSGAACTSYTGQGPPSSKTSSRPKQEASRRTRTFSARNHHPAAEALEERRVADEVDSVSQPLLRVQEKSSSSNVEPSQSGRGRLGRLNPCLRRRRSYSRHPCSKSALQSTTRRRFQCVPRGRAPRTGLLQTGQRPRPGLPRSFMAMPRL